LGHVALDAETRQVSEDVTLVTLTGELDVYTSQELRQRIADLVDRGLTRLILDLNGVSHMDSTGLGVLIGAMRQVTKSGGDLKLLCDNRRTLRMLGITGMDRIFEICRDEEQARQAFAHA